MDQNNTMHGMEDATISIKIDDQSKISDVCRILEENGYVQIYCTSFPLIKRIVAYPEDEEDPMSFDLYGCTFDEYEESLISCIFYTQNEFIEKYGTSISKN